MGKVKWNKELVIEEIHNRTKSGLKLNAQTVIKQNQKLYNAAKKHFESWGNAIEQAGFNYDEIRLLKPVGFWTKEATIHALQDRMEQGLPMNRNSIIKDDGGLHNGCIRHFGSYQKAIEECGWEYDDIREDMSLMSYYGIKFESLLRDIFTDMGMMFTKGFNNDIIPDFVFPNGEWADAKLSEWSLYWCDTVEKYEPHCNKLTIIYLRGNKSKVEILTDKTNIISVYKLIKHLPKDKQIYYTKLLDDLYEKADNQENIIEDKLKVQKDSFYKGVYWRYDSQKWASSITFNKNTIHLGAFEEEVEAAKAYDKYIIENKLNKSINFGENQLAKEAFQSKYVGVYWTKNLKKWTSKIQINKNRISLGCFETEVEAALTYNNYIIENNLDRQLNQISDEELDILNTITPKRKDKKKNSKSSFVGVSWYTRLGKWKSTIRINGKVKFLGYFSVEIDAAKTVNNYILDNKLDIPLNEFTQSVS